MKSMPRRWRKKLAKKNAHPGPPIDAWDRKAEMRRRWHNDVVLFAANVRERIAAGMPLIPKEQLSARERDPKFIAAVQRILESES